MRVPNPKRPTNPKPWQKTITPKQWAIGSGVLVFLIFAGLLARIQELEQQNTSLYMELRRIREPLIQFCAAGTIPSDHPICPD